MNGGVEYLDGHVPGHDGLRSTSVVAQRIAPGRGPLGEMAVDRAPFMTPRAMREIQPADCWWNPGLRGDLISLGNASEHCEVAGFERRPDLGL
jgi:hypothetical protein